MLLNLNYNYLSSSLISVLLTIFNLIVIFQLGGVFIQQLTFIVIIAVFMIQFKFKFYKIDGYSFIFIVMLIFSIFFSLIFNIESYISFFALLNFLLFSYYLSVFARYNSDVFIESLKKYSILNLIFIIYLLLKSGLQFDSRSIIEGVQPNYIGLTALTGCLSALLLKNNYMKYLFFSIFLFTSFIVSSRAAMMCIILICLLSIFLKIKENKKSMVFVFLIIFFNLIYFYQNIFMFFSKIFMLDDQYRGADSGLSGRSDRWEIAFQYISEKPILGYGLKTGESLLGFTTDNGYISVLLELGIVGFLIYICMLSFSFFLSFYNLIKSSSLINQFCFISIFIFLIYMFFEQRYINFGNPLSFIVFFSIFYVFSLSKTKSFLRR